MKLALLLEEDGRMKAWTRRDGLAEVLKVVRLILTFVSSPFGKPEYHQQMITL